MRALVPPALIAILTLSGCRVFDHGPNAARPLLDDVEVFSNRLEPARMESAGGTTPRASYDHAARSHADSSLHESQAAGKRQFSSVAFADGQETGKTSASYGMVVPVSLSLDPVRLAAGTPADAASNRQPAPLAPPTDPPARSPGSSERDMPSPAPLEPGQDTIQPLRPSSDEPAMAEDRLANEQGRTECFSLSDLEQIVLANNPAVARAAARVEALAGKWQQVGMLDNPVFGYVADEMGDGGTAGRQGAYVQFTIPRGGKLALNRNVVSQELEKAERELAAAQMRATTDVRLGYFDYLLAWRQVELAQTLVELSEQAVQDMQILLERGEVRKAEVLRLEMEAARMRIVQNNAQNERAAAWRRLATVLGSPDLPAYELDSRAVKEKLNEAASLSIDHAEALQRLLRESPQLAAAMADVERAQWALQRAKAEIVPDLNSSLTVTHDTLADDTLTSIQVGLPLPLINRNQGGIRQTHAELVAANEAARQAELKLRRQFESLYQRFANARKRVREFADPENGILAKAQESLRLTKRGYEAGEFSSLELLTAQQQFNRANVDYLAALREVWATATEIHGLLLKDSLESTP